MVVASYKVMRVKSSVIVPILAILSGVLLQLNSLGIFGRSALSNDVLMKLWPLLLAVAALDLLFSHRRVIGALVLLFTAAALLSSQFASSGPAAELWQIFLKFWPILLILFGIDIIFSGRGIVNAVVLIIGVLILIYAVLAALDVPIIRQLPFDLSSITSVLTEPDRFIPTKPSPSGQPQPVPGMNGPADMTQDTAPFIIGADGKVTAGMPSQNAVMLNLNASSGRISLKADGQPGRVLGGTVKLDPKEKLTYDSSLSGQTAVYTLTGKGSGAAPDASVWDLQLSSQRTADLNIVLDNGYVKADLRGLNLNAVNIENKFGPVDVMAPQRASGKVRISAGSGDIRLYIPKNVRISCSISGAADIEYPQRNYMLNNNTLTPRSAQVMPVEVEIISNGGKLRIIESE